MDGMSQQHNVRFENHEGLTIIDSDGVVNRYPSGMTTITCSCGLDTGAIPSAEARQVYEQHWRETRPENAAGTEG